MDNYLLKKMIIGFREGDMKAFAVIYDRFKGIINYYSRKIGDEDSYQELMIFLVETLYSIDLSRFPTDKNDNLNRYIAVSLRNKYIAISKKNQKDENMLLSLYENDSFYSCNEDEIFIKDMLGSLSHKQRKIIIYRYIYGYSDAEISDILGISRQAVNRLKNRGLEALRNIYFEENYGNLQSEKIL